MSCVTITRDITVSGVYAARLRNFAGYTSSLPMAFAAEARLAEGLFRRLKLTLNELKSLKFRFGPRRPTVFKREERYFEPLKLLRVVKKYITVTPPST
jgi:hypothetical protein